MTNFEKYKDEILAICNEGCGFGVVKNTNKMLRCGQVRCGDCEFSSESFCTAYKFKWLYEECNPVVLDDFTTELLRRLYDAGWRYIAKSELGKAHVYKGKPFKSSHIWDSSYASLMIHSDIAEFDFLSWNDKEPTLIEDLIKNNQKRKEDKNV